MFALDDCIAGAKATASVLPSVVKVIQKLREDRKDPTMVRVVDEMYLAAVEACQKLRHEISELGFDLNGAGVDLDRPLSEIYKDLSWLGSFPTKFKLSRYRKKVEQIHMQLMASTEELVSVLVCTGQLTDLSEAYASARDARRYLDELTFSDPPLRKILEEYARMTDQYLVDLQT